ncbi:hypothetical protein M3J09_000606 [Ascochyta lentis]
MHASSTIKLRQLRADFRPAISTCTPQCSYCTIASLFSIFRNQCHNNSKLRHARFPTTTPILYVRGLTKRTERRGGAGHGTQSGA